MDRGTLKPAWAWKSLMAVSLVATENGESSAPRLVFLVDDEERNLRLFEMALKTMGFLLMKFPDGQKALDTIMDGVYPDLILSDVMMPELDGFSLCMRLKADIRTCRIPVVLVTGLDDLDSKVRGLESGADDFLTKPFSPVELRVRVRSLMRIKALSDELEEKNKLLTDEKGVLEQLVVERTQELQSLTIGIVAALEKANALHDSDTGLHILRVCSYTYELAVQLGLDPVLASKLRMLASLHDVGKVGIPDAILKKQGRLTPDEYDQMKQHTVYGFELLGLAKADTMARNIALSHHEKFDGSGYPQGLKGEAIPTESRIVALADVYDAITTKRCYKEAYSSEEAVRIINEESGRHFDPKVVEAMMRALEQFHRIGARYHDPA